MKILLVEDNARLSELVKKNLEKDNFVVDIASNLVDAVTKSEIEDKLYDHDKEISSNPIEVTLFRLRKNLERNKSNLIINNLKGIGYRLVNAK
jgi:DNA-binding response OmpR family regulator